MFLYACTKNDAVNTTGTRLKMIVTNGQDEFQRDCSNCFYYQFFRYDTNGRLVSIKDSSSDGMAYRRSSYVNGPHIYTLDYSYTYYRSIEYDLKDKPIRAGRDSFIYNSNNQIIERYRRVQCETCASYLYNKYIYDTKGRLIADSNYTGQTFLIPRIVLQEFTICRYDDNDNVVQSERINAYPPDSARHNINSLQYTYDQKPNPFKAMGLLAYMVFHDPQIVSKNNFLTKDYTYEYYPNGMIWKISYKGRTQEFLYE
jgi:hypothetical protein